MLSGDESIVCSTSTSGESSSSSSESAVLSGDEAQDLPSLVPQLPFRIDGIRFAYEQFAHQTNPARSHKRIIATCNNHEECIKRRGIGIQQCSMCGLWEPVAFLLAWAEGHVHKTTPKEHVRWKPIEAQVRAAFPRVEAFARDLWYYQSFYLLYSVLESLICLLVYFIIHLIGVKIFCYV